MTRSSRRLRLCVAVSLVVPATVLSVSVTAADARIGTCVSRVPGQDRQITGNGIYDWAIGEPGRGDDAGAVHLVAPQFPGYRDLRLVQGAPVLAGGAAVPGTAEAGDRFGAATVTGDFDGDGCLDLAVGAPGENGGRGSVTVLFSGSDAPTPNRIITESTFTAETARPGEGFGATLAVGNLDGDERPDLVIGIPGERVTATGSGQGGFVVVHSDQLAIGVTRLPQRIVTAASAGVPGTPEDGDRLGASLATGDFDGDGDTDLAVGVPGENTGRGAVVAFTNAGNGIGLPAAARAFDQDSPGVPGRAEAGDRFGAALAAGQLGFPGASVDDLAVGAPGENASAGSVTFLPGATTSGLTGAGSTVVGQDTAGVVGTARAGDRFGAALLVAQLDEKSFTNSVAIGAPGDVVSGRAGAGSVTFLAATGAGPAVDLDVTTVAQLTQDTAALPRVPGTAEAGDGFGSSLSSHGAAADWVLLVGVPGEDLGGVRDAGAASVFDGAVGFGLRDSDAILLEADTPGIVGVRDPGGRFGAALDG